MDIRETPPGCARGDAHACGLPGLSPSIFHTTPSLFPTSILLLALLFPSAPLQGQTPDTPAAGDSVATDSVALAAQAEAPQIVPPKPSLPVFLVLGIGYGDRSDACVLCGNPQDDKSFTAHLSVGRPLGKGFGIGLDASVWRKGRPGTPVVADSTGIPTAQTLANLLGNLSISFSYQIWHVYVRAGGGLAFGSQDLEMTAANGDLLVHTASGFGVGYSAGAGVTVPLASVVSLAFFGNWNVGQYDMVSPQGLTQRDAKHEYLELGVGVAVR
jgi:hypothetical protein